MDMNLSKVAGKKVDTDTSVSEENNVTIVKVAPADMCKDIDENDADGCEQESELQKSFELRRRNAATSSSEESIEDVTTASCKLGRQEFTFSRRKSESRPEAPSTLRAGEIRKWRSSSPIDHGRKIQPVSQQTFTRQFLSSLEKLTGKTR